MKNIDTSAQIVWDYMHMHQPLEVSDAILALGSHDLKVAEYAARLFLEEYAPYLIFSGGLGRLTEGVFLQPEAERFKEVAIGMGVPEERIITEPNSTNTGENILFTKQLLEEMGLDFQRFIVIQKPYMERRTYATFAKQWPGKEFIVSSSPASFLEYPSAEIPKDEMISIMVGDLQRIKEYPARGFQIPQEIPTEVWSAFEALVAAGYTFHLIKD